MNAYILFLVVGVIPGILTQQNEITVECDRYHAQISFYNSMEIAIDEQMAVIQARENSATEEVLESLENAGAVEPEPVDVEEPTILSQAEGIEATQSSVGWGGDPARAIDGNTASEWGGGSCTHTQNGDSWWKLDMRQSFSVVYIRLFNRADCCHTRIIGAVIRVGDSDTITSNDPCGEPVNAGDVANGPMISRTCAAGTSGRYVSVHVNNYLTLCEVEVYSAVILSHGRLATQSSIGWGGVPSRAVDGSAANNYNHHSCTHTQSQSVNWWMLDLGSSYTVSFVRIYNRQDCCSDRLNGATVLVGDNADGQTTNPQCGDAVADAGASVDFACSPALSGRYVSVSLPNNYLTLCEVEVWGEGEATTVVETPTGLVSLGRETAQSSTGWGGEPLRAVDGDYNGRYDGRSCTHTQNERPSWWRVDLGASVTVRYVKITNRADCCNDRLNTAVIRVGDSEDVVSNEVCGTPFTMEDIAGHTNLHRICADGTGLQGRYVSVNVNNYLTLCEVEVFDALPLALGATATQSSFGWGGEPARAIDGNRNTNYGGSSCTHTQNTPNSWWKVDLGDTYDIALIHIYNRADCCNTRMTGAIIRVSTTEDPTSGEACGEPIQASDIQMSQKLVRECALNGRYVSITVSNYLTLCEVEIFGTRS